ncbi:MAG: hypothetical protein L6V78_03650 [Clostridium sp.]|nr:MAG: hypothetical protein L6V78_03650 [Clostridium sp.]
MIRSIKLYFLKKYYFNINVILFLALFGESVRKCGNKEEFLNKYNFDCNQNMMLNINDGIIDAFK